jgi:hypothetical protein
MHVAFHFDEDLADVANVPITPMRDAEVAVIRGVLSTVPAYRQHVRIRSGNPGAGYLPDVSDELRLAIFGLLGGNSSWRTISDFEQFALKLTRRLTCVVLVEGIPLEDAVLLDRMLRGRRDYFGAIQVRTDNAGQWAFYVAVLPLRYRVYAGVVSLLYSMEYDPEVRGEDDRDHQWKRDLNDLLGPLALGVSFASVGLQDTLFDTRDSFGDADRAGRMERVLGSAFSHVADEIYLRARQIDPSIIEIFDVALRALEKHDSPEQLSHVALSCRRLMERLADALYPATGEVINGRKMSQEKFVRRLWQYAAMRLSDSNAAVIQANINDVGARIDKLHDAANAGLHGMAEAAATHRLLINLTMLTFDLLVINDIDAGASPGYEREQTARIAKFILCEEGGAVE